MRTALLIAAATAALYLPRLGSAPIYLAPDEVFIGLQANALATTGRDYGGRRLPLYVEYEYRVSDAQGPIRHGWLPPIIYYAIALTLLVRPLSEAVIRFPTVVVGIVNVVLMYFIGLRLFKREALAVLCAALLALTPAHFIHSRFAMDYLYPVPFVLAWLLGLLAYLEDGRESRLFLATLALGVGLFSYIAAAIVMPLYLVVTLSALARTKRNVRAYGVALLGFVLPASLHIPWIIAHPTAITDILSKYGLDDSSGASIRQSVRSLVTFQAIGDQISRLWTFFDPRFFFFHGPMELMYSTRAVGVFLVPIAVLLIVGLRAAFRGPLRNDVSILVVALLLAPLGATLVPTPGAVYRALEILPFVVLLSVLGLEYLWSSERSAPARRAFVATGSAIAAAGVVYGIAALTRIRLPEATLTLVFAGIVVIGLGLLSGRLRFGQLAALGLLAIVPLQFAHFYVDYFTDYQRRASMVFSGNIRGALEETIREAQQTQAPAIYLGRVGPYGKGMQYWLFYLAKYRLDSLESRTLDVGRFDADEVLALEPGSVIVTNAGEGQSEATIDRLVAAGQLAKTVIREPDGTPTFLVLRRPRAVDLRDGTQPAAPPAQPAVGQADWKVR